MSVLMGTYTFYLQDKTQSMYLPIIQTDRQYPIMEISCCASQHHLEILMGWLLNRETIEFEENICNKEYHYGHAVLIKGSLVKQSVDSDELACHLIFVIKDIRAKDELTIKQRNECGAKTHLFFTNEDVVMFDLVYDINGDLFFQVFDKASKWVYEFSPQTPPAYLAVLGKDFIEILLYSNEQKCIIITDPNVKKQMYERIRKGIC